MGVVGLTCPFTYRVRARELKFDVHIYVHIYIYIYMLGIGAPKRAPCWGAERPPKLDPEIYDFRAFPGRACPRRPPQRPRLVRGFGCALWDMGIRGDTGACEIKAGGPCKFIGFGASMSPSHINSNGLMTSMPPSPMYLQSPAAFISQAPLLLGSTATFVTPNT